MVLFTLTGYTVSVRWEDNKHEKRDYDDDVKCGLFQCTILKFAWEAKSNQEKPLSEKLVIWLWFK